MLKINAIFSHEKPTCTAIFTVFNKSRIAFTGVVTHCVNANRVGVALVEALSTFIII